MSVLQFLSSVASYDAASIICQALGRGVTRSKRKAKQWMRMAAENGHPESCIRLAAHMYMDRPHAREVGHVGEAAGVAAPTGVPEGHYVPPDVLTSVVHWLRKGGRNPVDMLSVFRGEALEGAAYCSNDGCLVKGLLLKDFKLCPQCKVAPYCGAACQKADWTTGGHKEQTGFITHSTAFTSPVLNPQDPPRLAGSGLLCILSLDQALSQPLGINSQRINSKATAAGADCRCRGSV
jgi:hypothetical protein